MTSVKKIIATLASKVAPQIRYLAPAYSSEGEDLILKRIFDNKTNGVYVDVGAHHPFRVSNTYLFYKMNWTGINIDPMPGSKALFDKYRPRDVNLEMGVSATRQHLTYHIFNEPALNTFSQDKIDEYTQDPKYQVIREKKIETWPLADILDHYLPANKPIDFLTIDAEGLDMDVLRSNNWEKYRPTYILVESNPFLLSDMQNCELGQFMEQAGYAIFAKTYYTYFFKNMSHE
ncbi:FkbM family methyltransferase [Chitinophaga agri]|uniref:FkbM family methyltransferase n=1 Tax=Chitinophaga agri TaxID=2703787 RepID=A0A6B9ZKT9_9BACT|nr:FkbM family methyltransferase [Chitinophaga agri]QHS63040.1 FkbM family methyltransferase [Chitinophaga agri]